MTFNDSLGRLAGVYNSLISTYRLLKSDWGLFALSLVLMWFAQLRWETILLLLAFQTASALGYASYVKLRTDRKMYFAPGAFGLHTWVYWKAEDTAIRCAAAAYSISACSLLGFIATGAYFLTYDPELQVIRTVLTGLIFLMFLPILPPTSRMVQVIIAGLGFNNRLLVPVTVWVVTLVVMLFVNPLVHAVVLILLIFWLMWLALRVMFTKSSLDILVFRLSSYVVQTLDQKVRDAPRFLWEQISQEWEPYLMTNRRWAAALAVVYLTLLVGSYFWMVGAFSLIDPDVLMKGIFRI